MKLQNHIVRIKMEDSSPHYVSQDLPECLTSLLEIDCIAAPQQTQCRYTVILLPILISLLSLHLHEAW